MVRAMCLLQLKDRKLSKDLMLMFGLNETLDQLVMANSVCWHGHVLWREDGHVVRRALEVRPMGAWKKQVEEEGVKVGLRREDAL